LKEKKNEKSILDFHFLVVYQNLYPLSRIKGEENSLDREQEYFIM